MSDADFLPINASERTLFSDKARAGHVGFPYHGCIRIGRRVLWRCEHSHGNRDITTRSSGISARDCSRRVLSYAQSDDAVERMAAWLRTNPTNATRIDHAFHQYAIQEAAKVRELLVRPPVGEPGKRAGD